MNDKAQLITALADEFNRWEKLLAGLGEEQIIAPLPDSSLSVKDVIAHLWAWQQVSIARLEAALQNKYPEFPEWFGGSPPDSDENLDQFNENIYQANRRRTWSDVHQAWKDGFLKFMELAKKISEKDLLEVGKYSWIEGYALSDVLLGSYEHHEEHLEPLLVLFPRNENRNKGAS